MLLDDAIDLLINGDISINTPQQWADLGCGSGLFTQALAQILPPQSTVFAIDTHSVGLKKIPESVNNTTILTLQADFVQDTLSLPLLDGVLMANSLHYVKDKPSFVQKLRKVLKSSHFWLIVEHDSDKANLWVPFPVSFKVLQEFCRGEGFQVKKLHEKPSVYHASGMYSAIIRL